MDKKTKVKTKESKRNQVLTVVVVVFLLGTFAFGFIYGLNKVLAMEGNFPPVINAEGLTAEPTSPDEAVAFLNDMIDKAEQESPLTSRSTAVSIPLDDENYPFFCSGSDSLLNTVGFIRDDFTDIVEGCFPNDSVNYGESNSSVIRKPQIKASDVTDFSCNYIYYQCISTGCGEISDEPLTHCKKCGSEYPYAMKYADEYTISLTFDATDDTLLKNNFDPRTEKEMTDMIMDSFGEILSVDSLCSSCDSLQITYKVNRLKNELTYLSFRKVLLLDTEFAFKDTYAAVGTQSIQCACVRDDRFFFTWPSLKLKEHTKTVPPKSTDNLQAVLTCEDPAVPVVSWASSDENLISVDDEGYLKTGKETGTAVITATFEYLGKTYSDSCEVLVRVPVEGMTISRKKVSLPVGDSFSLSTKISPKDATVQSVTWYSENEDIAKIDENGTVTACGAGKVIVYALSDDGYYKSSCEVTVE